MNKSAKILYPILALLAFAVPLAASADYQNFSLEKISFFPDWNANDEQSFFQSLNNRLPSVIGNFIAFLNSQNNQENENKETVNLFVKAKRKIIATAYSSTPGQTDNSPFITAAGTFVREGIVAANFLKFGTLVRFPEVYGDKIFVVEDRMAPKNNHKVDVWMESSSQALQFGVKYLTVEILES